MDAALEVLNGVGVELRSVEPTRRDEIVRLESRALGSGGRISGEIVQQGENAAAKPGDARERVHLAPLVEREDTRAGSELDILLREAPLRGTLRLRQLGDEAIEGDMALLDADRRIVEHGVERRWVAGVVHAQGARIVRTAIGARADELLVGDRG